MGSPWKGFVEFTLPASPPAAFVSADLNSTSPVGLSLSPYGRSVSAQPSALHPTFPHSPELDSFIEHPLLPLSALFLYPIILISRLRGWPRSLAIEMSSNERWRGKNDDRLLYSFDLAAIEQCLTDRKWILGFVFRHWVNLKHLWVYNVLYLFWCNGPVVEAGRSLSSIHFLLPCSLVPPFPVASSN